MSELTHIGNIIAALEAKKMILEHVIGDLRTYAGGPGRTEDVERNAPKERRPMSAAGKKAISDAVKRRWARVHAEKASAARKRR